jgi:hypothetical protein
VRKHLQHLGMEIVANTPLGIRSDHQIRNPTMGQVDQGRWNQCKRIGATPQMLPPQPAQSHPTIHQEVLRIFPHDHDRIRGTHFETTHENGDKSRVGFTSDEEVGMGKTLFSLTFATALLALASSEASAFVYSSFVCQAVGVRSVGWGRSFFVGEAKMIALSMITRKERRCD